MTAQQRTEVRGQLLIEEWGLKLMSRLVEGNVITVEPGIYVPFDSSYPKHFHGLGVRIEDEVAFTEDGPLVLSANAPKEIVDIEAACQGTLDRTHP